MDMNPTPSKTEQLREIAKAAATPATNTPPKTPPSDKLSATDAEIINTLEHIKRLVIENQKALKEKPDRAEVAALVGQEVESAKREIVAAIPATMPVTQEPRESGPVGLRPGAWVGLILVFIITVGMATAWQTWKIHELDNTIFGELSQIFKAIKK